MRRPHVYERSAPRPARTAYVEPLGDVAQTRRDIAHALSACLVKAQSRGLVPLADLVQRALDEAETGLCEAPAAMLHASSRLMESGEPVAADVEGLRTMLNRSAILNPSEA